MTHVLPFTWRPMVLSYSARQDSAGKWVWQMPFRKEFYFPNLYENWLENSLPPPCPSFPCYIPWSKFSQVGDTLHFLGPDMLQRQPSFIQAGKISDTYLPAFPYSYTSILICALDFNPGINDLKSALQGSSISYNKHLSVSPAPLLCASVTVILTVGISIQTWDIHCPSSSVHACRHWRLVGLFCSIILGVISWYANSKLWVSRVILGELVNYPISFNTFFFCLNLSVCFFACNQIHK